MVKDVFSDILLGVAVLMVAGASLGVLLMRDAYQKLHFVTPAALVAPLLVALAILAQVGASENTGETFLTPAPIERFQSGVVNDYVTWIVLGLACIGGGLALVFR